MTEEEQRDFDSFNEASTSSQTRKGKTPLWKVFQENIKFFSHRLIRLIANLTLRILARLMRRPELWDHSEASSQHQPPQLALAKPQAHTQPKVVDQAVDQAPARGPAHFPLILHQNRQLPAAVRHRDRDSLAEDDDSYSINLVLREKQARSEVLDRVAEFCGLARANTETKKEVMGMQRPIYNEQRKRAIELSLPWHNSTMQIAQRNYDIVKGRLSKSMKSLNPAKPWGPRDHFTGSGYYTHNAEGYVPVMARYL